MRVAVVMSTYQGERYLQAQLESILQQLPPDGMLLVRDDGSTDATLSVLASVRDPRVRVTSGSNIGFVASFFSLLGSVPRDAEVVMLSDQDDVWLPGKIARACAALQDRDEPTLYCSRQVLVDEALRPLADSVPPARGPSFANALVENIVTGCTAALNRPALELVLRHGDLRLIRFHDWWMYLVVSAFGRVIADETPTLLYRQHAGNVIGRGAGWRRYLENLRFVRRQSWVHIMVGQIDNFRAVHGTRLAADQRALLDRFFDPGRPASLWRLLLTPRRFRQRLLDDFLLRMLLAWAVVGGSGLRPLAAKASA